MYAKLFKRIRYVLIILLVLIVFLFISIRIWLGYRFDSEVDINDYKSFSREIKTTEKLPENVYIAFEKVYNYNQNSTCNGILLKTPVSLLFNVEKPNCPCFEINYGFALSFIDRLTVGIQLDKDVGSQRCLDYYLNNFDFLNGQKGIKPASIFYYEKPLNKLSDVELIELCIMTKNPLRYNKKIYPEELVRERNRILDK